MLTSYLRLVRIAVLLAFLLPVVLIGGTAVAFGRVAPSWFWAKVVIGVLAAVASAILVGRLLRSLERLAGNASVAQARFLDSFADRLVPLAIFASAALSLLLELAVIRWQGGLFPFFSFYKNFSLLMCFAGLGLGYSLARREAIPLFFTIPILAGQMLLLTTLRYGIGREHLAPLWTMPFTEQLNMGVMATHMLSFRLPTYAFLAVVFLLTALAFVPVGQLCGRLMLRRSNLPAYGLNLLGSLAGVFLLSALSFLWTPPAVWFSLSFLLLLPFFLFDLRVLFAGGVSALVAIVMLVWPVSPGVEMIYSPYQLLERTPGEHGWTTVTAAGHDYQRIYDLSSSNLNRGADRSLRELASFYEFPYRVHDGPLRSVVVVGAGTGNDVAAALRSGAQKVDAVEIDPAIVRVGELYHPEKPYGSPLVRTVVNDARTFLRTTDRTYDMVVYGTLDSHVLLSHASSVRIDSFVYTVEGLRESRARLAEDGVMSLSFCVIAPGLGRKIYLMMEQAFDGSPPICVVGRDSMFVTFLQSRRGSLSVDPRLLAEAGLTDVTAQFADAALPADVSTDDWPFFYMPTRQYPFSYVHVLVLVLVLSFLTARTFGGVKLPSRGLPFFLMGAGFMLVETKAITELGLAFGNTWHVVGIVIAAILLMGFGANALVARIGLTRPFVPFVLLLLSLVAGNAVALSGGLGSSSAGKAAAIALLTLPMFFSGIAFSALLNTEADISAMMSVNLFGAMVGGILEYNSMYFGFAFLYLLAAALYCAAWVLSGLGLRAPVLASSRD